MGLKKYEIITVGGDKRVRALRSWQVGDRYVNIGDVGGIVYDENTLSQEGNCWIFSGKLNYPSIRVGGDSVVDTNGYEGAVTDPRPFVNITGASALIGAHEFVTGKVSAAKVLAVGDVEQGDVSDIIGTKYDESKVADANAIRLKSLIYMGGVSATVTLAGEGYQMQLMRYDAEKKLVSGSVMGTSASTEGAYYIGIQIRKNPAAATVPADITAAKVTIPSTAIESTINIKDSRIVFNYTSAMTVATKVNPSSASSTAAGLNSNISESNVAISKSGSGNGVMNIFADIDHCNVTVSALNALSALIGTFKNVKRLLLDGTLAWGDPSAAVRASFNFTDCDTVAYTNMVFPTSTITAVATANMPFIFQGCNVPNGIFYHHAQIANTYRDINFDLATADLGKLSVNGYRMVSSEVNGMYRLYSTTGSLFGALVESHESIKSLNMTGGTATYGTTIYKDTYLNGLFDLAGTNVFGNKVRSHPLAQVLNVQPRAVQGNFNTATVGQTVTGVSPSDIRVCIPTPFRINGANGLKIEGLSATLETLVIFVTPSNVVTAVVSSSNGVLPFPAARLNDYAAYVCFGKTGGAAITPEDLAGVTVTVYNGCKIVNTGETAVSMRGNIRVEDNATLINNSVVGSGYFGGNAVMSGVTINGCVYMRDNTSMIKTAGSGIIRNLRMTENAYAVLGDFALNGRIHLSDNVKFTPTGAGLPEGDLIMEDNAVISGAIIVGGMLTMKDNAKVSAGTLSAYGDITLCGGYVSTINKTFMGKRVIDNTDAPAYDDNVKTQYDF